MSSVSACPRKKRDARRGFFLLLYGVCGFLAAECAMAQTPQAVDKSAENLMLVLRETNGANKQDEALMPMTRGRAKLSDGKEVEFEIAAFALIGDIHIRFVFDGPSYMPNANPQDLIRLNLSAEQALRLAVGNIKRVYGDPVAKPWTGGLMQVEGKSPDFDSTYFLPPCDRPQVRKSRPRPRSSQALAFGSKVTVREEVERRSSDHPYLYSSSGHMRVSSALYLFMDRAFWQGLLRQYPEGVVVAVTKRGSLLVAPVTDSEAVDLLRIGVTCESTAAQAVAPDGSFWPTPSIVGIRPARTLSRGELSSRPEEHHGRI